MSKSKRNRRKIRRALKRFSDIGRTIPIKGVSRLDKVYRVCSGICRLCGKPVERKDASIDHIIPKASGGSNKYENLQLAHKICNSVKGDGEFDIAELKRRLANEKMKGL